MGTVYMLGNMAMPTFYKIGMTNGCPVRRARDLSKPTGIPTDFDLICYFSTNTAKQDEQGLHDFLCDFRYSFAREFFRFGYAHMPWALGLFKFHPNARHFWLCDGWKHHRYVPEEGIQNPWAQLNEEGWPAMSPLAPDVVYTTEGRY